VSGFYRACETCGGKGTIHAPLPDLAFADVAVSLGASMRTLCPACDRGFVPVDAAALRSELVATIERGRPQMAAEAGNVARAFRRLQGETPGGGPQRRRRGLDARARPPDARAVRPDCTPCNDSVL
jgi:hypothetical protein